MAASAGANKSKYGSFFLQERIGELNESIRSTIEFYYKKSKASGKTEYESLLQSQRATGRISKKLINPPTILPEFIHVWGWFEELIDCRESSFGVSTIQPPVIESYFRLMWINPNPVEVQVFRLIDKTFVGIIGSEEGK